jgi:two-component system response regulator ChvI
MKQRIALVDDDKNILTSVSMALEAEGFLVESFHDGETALESLLKSPVDLVILDIKMPRMDGLEVLKKIRESSKMPVVFLTSKDDEIDQVTGLRLGADDYITKPFSQRLLIERIRTILRRDQMRLAEKPTTPDNIIQQGDLRLDEDKHLCSWKNIPIEMTVTEFLLIKLLSQRVGHVKSREQLINYAYGDSVYVDDRTIDSHIKRLRKKFKEADAAFDNIETVYGVGYRYNNA